MGAREEKVAAAAALRIEREGVGGDVRIAAESLEGLGGGERGAVDGTVAVARLPGEAGEVG